ncbi:type II CRISPR RNA-guided endonuclease Cas9 [uncultured Acidaminococcus sp.]|uniref:type II CRISPR RNA-guided endonuclease Cas9 n=1 Tax=uncultured Acidaminococcus sp. TaxID=352152 RepID=UPI0025CDF834|nr:type II CRISPR RNA-guided endonuclease Cas9 [uncultured Acidaminococcus sp.]
MGKYYLGLDMGTNSVGWAVTDDKYQLLRAKGKDLWGARLFSEAETAAARRFNRTARRRLQRQKVRNGYLRELFADTINSVDPGFFQRLADSNLYEEDKTVTQPFALFNDKKYTDKEFYKQYPTIFHLIVDLIHSREPKDVRLVYLAVLNIFNHRGHFLNENLQGKGVAKFEDLFYNLKSQDPAFEQVSDEAALKSILSDRRNTKGEACEKVLKLFSPVVKKNSAEGERVKLLCGLSGKLAKAFPDVNLDEAYQKFSFSFRDSDYDEKMEEIQGLLDNDILDELAALKEVHDWALISNLMAGKKYLSEARISLYEKHHQDLEYLKAAYKKYCPELYDKMFRLMEDNNYSAYVGSVNALNCKKRRGAKCTLADFYKRIKADLGLDAKNVDTMEEDKKYIFTELEKETFLPKQLSASNGVIPYQLHLAELHAILENTSSYLPFLQKVDETGLSVAQKIEELFQFKIPYFVGPLYKDPSGKNNAWLVRKESGRILPWNFEKKVDLKASAAQFIQKLVGHCTYLNDELVLPNESLLYEKFRVLNELNNLKINGERIEVDVKQKIYKALFRKGKKVTQKQICAFLRNNGYVAKTDPIELSGVDGDFKNTLTSYARFSALLGVPELTKAQEDMAEKIIEWGTAFGESKKFLREKIVDTYGSELTAAQLKRLMGYKFRDWGRLSRKFLNLQGIDKTTGEQLPLIAKMWESNYNLMELLSDQFTYKDTLEKFTDHKVKELNEVQFEDLDGLYLSNPVKRMIWQTVLILKELHHVLGEAPSRIFVEMARDNNAEKKRNESRKSRLLELYKSLKNEGRTWAKEIEGQDESAFRQKKLYLYYCQMGKCMYTGESIDLHDLFNDNLYDIDHIYPRHFVKDDSLDNNLVLVRKEKNAHKQDVFPLESTIQEHQYKFWEMLLQRGLINQEKFYRLTRKTPFTDEELAGFIQRQIVETRQGTKVVASLLQQVFPETEIVYVKAGNVSQFRQHFDILKARAVNDFHHAHDAYLNVVVGNTYHVKFTKNPIRFIQDFRKDPKKHPYHMYKIFDYNVARNGEVAWDKDRSIAIVKKTIRKPSVLVTNKVYELHGQLTKAEIKPASIVQNAMIKGKEKAYIPVKQNSKLSNILRYGGKTSVTGTYFFLVESMNKKKKIRSIETVPLYLVNQLQMVEQLTQYCKTVLKLCDPVIRLGKIKMNSLLKINGALVYLTGRTGDNLLVANAVQLVLDYDLYQYSKKITECDCSITDAEYYEDRKITSEENEKLYNFLTSKYKTGILSKRINNVTDILDKGRSKFQQLGIIDQITVLREILRLSTRENQGVDLRLLGGGKANGRSMISKRISNLDSAYLITQSVTGLYTKKIDLLRV